MSKKDNELSNGQGTYRVIYVFGIDDEVHRDCLKIGETSLGKDYDGDPFSVKPNDEILNKVAWVRIDKFTGTVGTGRRILYHTELAVRKKEDRVEGFRDTNVHNVLKRSGIEQKKFESSADEWFFTDVKTAKNAIVAVKNGRKALGAKEISTDDNPIIFRPEQRKAIDSTLSLFENGHKKLWNAKMRFGKTLCALEVIKEANFARTLILTHRPVVDEGWYKDFGKIFRDRPDFIYGSKKKGELFETFISQSKKKKTHIIYFASMQDLRGSKDVGGKFDKNDKVFSTLWDLIIVDEAHEGTQTPLGQNVIESVKKHKSKSLFLSGTPFNLLEGFNEEEIYTWDYVDEQKAKLRWDKEHPCDHNPYADLPRMNIYTYDLGRLLEKYFDEDIAFSFTEFFHVGNNGEFIHKRDVQDFLDRLCGMKDNLNLYPFSNAKYCSIFRHTFWVLPGVKAAKALSQMLKNHPHFNNYKVINVAGDGDEDQESIEAYDSVKKNIGKDPDKTLTITLSCGRLTTGVTIPEWNGVLMLSGGLNTRAATYMQTIFRVQNPCTINGKMKEDAYVFDFAPDRTLQVISEYAKVSKKSDTPNSQQSRDKLGEFINFCPVISEIGGEMKRLNTEKMLDQLNRVYIEKVVQSGFENERLYNDNLLHLDDLDLEDFKNLQGTIGRTKALSKINDIEISTGGLTDEKHEHIPSDKPPHELTEEEKQRIEEWNKRKKQRADAISILRGLSIRMPLMIYGAEINDEEKEITIDNFSELVDDRSWEEFMPRDVTKEVFNKFKKYYNPDIFRGAGLRIRSLVKGADSENYTIEERIERIATIFSTFRNPDKETVLTPWRVVNLHMGDTLGGYSFFDENYQNSISDERYVDHGKITDEVFNADTRLLEINSKSGLYPLYLTYNVYRRRLKDLVCSAESFSDNQKVWDKVVSENIFVVCKTPMARSITERTLVGFRGVRVNAHYSEDLVNKIKRDSGSFISEINKLWNAKLKGMKFNAVVGNPPYQEMGGSGGNNDAPLYQHFATIAEKITGRYASLIMPARWFSAGRENLLGDFRNNFLKSGKISVLSCFTNGAEVFNNVEIKGGICFYLYDAQHEGFCQYNLIRDGKTDTYTRNLADFDILIREPLFSEVVMKVQKKHKGKYVDSIVSADTPFGISSNVKESKKNSINVYPSKEGHDTMLFHIEKLKRKIEYVNRNDIKKNVEFIDKYKVFIPGAGGTGSDPLVLGVPEYAPKNSVCSQSYLFIPFETEEEAQNFIKYLKTKFFRSLVASVKISQSAPNRVYRFVPLQSFTPKSDIDWTKPIKEIDQQLYKKYRLSKQEIGFIEKMIKEM